MAIVTLGIDLAKNVFAPHGVDAAGKPVAGSPECWARQAAGAGGLAAAVPNRRGGVLRRAPLGTRVPSARPHRTTDGFQVRRALSAFEQAGQERIGLVPGQYSSGGKQRLGRITKAGDPHFRMLLILGARAVLQSAKKKSDPVSRWAVQLAARVGYWKAIVAIAAKNARTCWAVLALGDRFKLPA